MMAQDIDMQSGGVCLELLLIPIALLFQTMSQFP